MLGVALDAPCIKGRVESCQQGKCIPTRLAEGSMPWLHWTAAYGQRPEGLCFEVFSKGELLLEDYGKVAEKCGKMWQITSI